MSIYIYIHCANIKHIRLLAKSFREPKDSSLSSVKRLSGSQSRNLRCTKAIGIHMYLYRNETPHEILPTNQ